MESQKTYSLFYMNQRLDKTTLHNNSKLAELKINMSHLTGQRQHKYLKGSVLTPSIIIFNCRFQSYRVSQTVLFCCMVAGSNKLFFGRKKEVHEIM